MPKRIKIKINKFLLAICASIIVIFLVLLGITMLVYKSSSTNRFAEAIGDILPFPAVYAKNARSNHNPGNQTR